MKFSNARVRMEREILRGHQRTRVHHLPFSLTETSTSHPSRSGRVTSLPTIAVLPTTLKEEEEEEEEKAICWEGPRPTSSESRRPLRSTPRSRRTYEPRDHPTRSRALYIRGEREEAASTTENRTKTKRIGGNGEGGGKRRRERKKLGSNRDRANTGESRI